MIVDKMFTPEYTLCQSGFSIAARRPSSRAHLGKHPKVTSACHPVVQLAWKAIPLQQNNGPLQQCSYNKSNNTNVTMIPSHNNDTNVNVIPSLTTTMSPSFSAIPPPPMSPMSLSSPATPLPPMQPSSPATPPPPMSPSSPVAPLPPMPPLSHVFYSSGRFEMHEWHAVSTYSSFSVFR